MNYRAWRLTKADAALFVLVGAVISLCLSCVLVWRAPYASHKKIWHQYDNGTSMLMGFRQLGVHHQFWRMGLDWEFSGPLPLGKEGVAISAVGLPFHAFQRRVEYPPNLLMYSSANYAPQYYFPSILHTDLNLYRPAWPGLLADTLFWGGLLYLIRGSFRALRARRRLRRGRCPACAYDRSGLDSAAPCPECAIQIASGPAISGGLSS